MDRQEIEQVVHKVLVEEFRAEPGAIMPEASFKEVGLDSLDVVSLVMALEDRLGVEIPESDLDGVSQIGQALDLLERKVGARA